MTTKRAWPNSAEWARQDVIGILGRATKEIREIIKVEDDPDVLRRLSELKDDLKEAEIKLKDLRPG